MKFLTILIAAFILSSCATQQNLHVGDQVTMKNVLLHKSSIYTIVGANGNQYDLKLNGTIYRNAKGLKLYKKGIDTLQNTAYQPNPTKVGLK